MSNFKVVSQTGHHNKHLDVGSLSAGSGSFSSVDGKLREGTMVGYTAAGVLESEVAVGLTATPNSATATATTAVKLPLGAVITQISVKNVSSSLTVTNTFSIGKSNTYSGYPAGLLSEITEQTINLGAMYKTNLASLTGVVATDERFLTVYPEYATASTYDGMKVTVSYVILE